MIEVGALSLVLALMVGCYSTLACMAAAFLRINNLASSGRYSLYTIPILLLIPYIKDMKKSYLENLIIKNASIDTYNL